MAVVTEALRFGDRVVAGAQKRLNNRRKVTLEPEGKVRGRVLLSYLIDPFLVDWSNLAPTDPMRWHSNAWECRQIAQIYLDLGFAVDAISGANETFQPDSPYSAVIDVRHNLQRLAPALNEDCVKIFHVDVANTLFQNFAEMQRLLSLRERRGVTLTPRRQEVPNRGIEACDCATILGNAFTTGTFAYAGKPMYPIPLSSNLDMPSPDDKDFEACRRNFVWIGSSGLVRKGLDVVLEAFAQMPDFHLYVCGAIGSLGARSRQGVELVRETDFEAEYYRELFELPNVHTLGWVDTSSDRFVELARQCLGMAYASSCEGQCGGVISCMHAGLIPVISYESGVDVDGFGFIFDSCTVEDVKRKLCEVAALPKAELRERAQQTWAYARTHHTRENFARVYQETAELILTRSGVLP